MQKSARSQPAQPQQANSQPAQPTPSRLRWLWWLLAYSSLALGLIGIVVPGLPTVPFVLLSAFAAARGSQRLYARLLAHRRFGPMIVDWRHRDHGCCRHLAVAQAPAGRLNTRAFRPTGMAATLRA